VVVVWSRFGGSWGGWVICCSGRMGNCVVGVWGVEGMLGGGGEFSC